MQGVGRKTSHWRLSGPADRAANPMRQSEQGDSKRYMLFSMNF